MQTWYYAFYDNAFLILDTFPRRTSRSTTSANLIGNTFSRIRSRAEFVPQLCNYLMSKRFDFPKQIRHPLLTSKYPDSLSVGEVVRQVLDKLDNFHILPNIAESQCKSMRERKIA